MCGWQSVGRLQKDHFDPPYPFWWQLLLLCIRLVIYKQVGHQSLGAQQLEKLVSEANDGVPVPPLFPGNIHLTDNSRIYFVSADNGDAGCEQ